MYFYNLHGFRSVANLIAKSTGCKGTYALMKLPDHNRLLQTVPDAMHTVKDLIEKIVYLVIGSSLYTMTTDLYTCISFLMQERRTMRKF